jgi:mannose-6-phosphate isomerase-like protein (cupin superfamily)
MLEKFEIKNMFKGWFIGNFEPTLYQTNDVEVAVKHYKAGDFENTHYHKIATEFTVILNGQVEMNGVIYNDNDIVKVNPGVSTDFKAITDVVTVVVKIPGATNDKYLKNKIND